MLTEENIQAIIANPQKESITLELKSFEKIFDSDSEKQKKKRKDLSYEIIALANRFGGKIIFGLNDNGTFDGKAPQSIDKIIETIQHMCYDAISPRIDITFQFLRCLEGDLLITNVPKKKNIPFASTHKENGEIKNRIYYIRTTHGKRLVSDDQLEWLFKYDNDPNYIHKLRIAIEFDKDYSLIGPDRPFGLYNISNFLNQLRQDEYVALFKGNTKFGEFFIQLLPWVVLKSLSLNYAKSWYIDRRVAFNTVAYGDMGTEFPLVSKAIKVEEIPTLGVNILDSLSWNFKDVVKNQFVFLFHVPAGTKLLIHYENAHRSKIVFENPDFEISISLGLMGWGSDLHPQNPYLHVLRERNYHSGVDDFANNFYHIDCAGYFQAKFEFPEKDSDLFQKYVHYSNTLKEIIDDFWNYQNVLDKLPPKEIYAIDDKLNEILSLLKK